MKGYSPMIHPAIIRPPTGPCIDSGVLFAFIQDLCADSWRLDNDRKMRHDGRGVGHERMSVSPIWKN
jgi:hypothetical protein